jgi:hypothetical protein
MFLHLVQVRAASESGEMAEEDEEQGGGGEIGEASGRAIKTLKDAIRDGLADA